MTEERLTCDAVTSFLADEFKLLPDDYDTTTPLFSSGLLDSFALTIMLVFIEARYGVRVASTDLTDKTLDTVDGIVRYVNAHTAT